MARVSVTQVKAIITLETGVVPDVDTAYQAAIDTANAIINGSCVNDMAEGVLKTQVELWLSAHYVALMGFDARTIQEEANATKQRFASKVDLGFNSTRYGQSAMNLDTTGCLAELNRAGKDGVINATIDTLSASREPDRVNPTDVFSPIDDG